MKIGLIQTRGIGDIIIAAPIAQYFIRQGHQIFWPVDSRFYSSVQIAFPNICFLPINEKEETEESTKEEILAYFYTSPLTELTRVNCDIVYCLYSRLRDTEGIVNQSLAYSLKFDEYKYAITKVPFAEKWNLEINRGFDREQKLFQLLNIRKNYVLIHDQGSNFKVDIALPDDILNNYQIIKISELTDNPFDWIGVIERASMFICLDSCFANLAEQLGICEHKSLILRSRCSSTPVFKNNWQFLINS